MQGTPSLCAWGQRTGATPGEGQDLNLSLAELSLEEVSEGHGEAGLEPARMEGCPEMREAGIVKRRTERWPDL